MKSSSRKAWSTINKLTGRKNISPNPNTISPNDVASVLLKNGKFNNPDKNFTRHVNHELMPTRTSAVTSQLKNLCLQSVHSNQAKHLGLITFTQNSSFIWTILALNGSGNFSHLQCNKTNFLSYGRWQRL